MPYRETIIARPISGCCFLLYVWLMNEAVIALLVTFGFFALLIWGVLRLIRMQNKKAWMQLGQLADALNIPFEGREERKNYKYYPSFRGDYRSKTISIHSETRGSGKSKHVVSIDRKSVV